METLVAKHDHAVRHKFLTRSIKDDIKRLLADTAHPHLHISANRARKVEAIIQIIGCRLILRLVLVALVNLTLGELCHNRLTLFLACHVGGCLLASVEG